jgi:hypothetical protein
MAGLGSYIGKDIIYHYFNRERRLPWYPDVYNLVDNNA